MLDKESSYREPPARCPECGATMAVKKVQDARLDVCGNCGGVWIDWFDGDPVRAVRGVGTVRHPASPVATDTRLQCPRCHVPLETESFRDEGPGVFRCNQCYGLHVPSESFHALAALSPNPTVPAEEEGSGMWDALSEMVGRLKHAIKA